MKGEYEGPRPQFYRPNRTGLPPELEAIRERTRAIELQTRVTYLLAITDLKKPSIGDIILAHGLGVDLAVNQP